MNDFDVDFQGHSRSNMMVYLDSSYMLPINIE